MAIDLIQLLAHTAEQGGSDLHIAGGQPPRVRIKGSLQAYEMDPLDDEEARESIYRILSQEQRAEFEQTWELDFSFEIPDVSRFRGNVFMQHRGPAGVFRVIPSKVMTLEQLNMPDVLRTLAEKDKGLVVVTGPTGSGKSTTLAAMVNHVNETRESHILTIEDPIEFVHESKKSLVNQREIGTHSKSFEKALRASLREDPDVILVGELRDLETTSLAITAAETGHLVFGTLHTNSASKTIDRLIDIFPAGQQSQVRTMLSESLAGVVAQQLLPTMDGEGRVAVIEVLVGVPALRALIREDKTAQILSLIQTGAQHGMQSLDQALQDLVMQGKLARREAMRISSNPKLFEGAASGPPPRRPGGPAGAAPPPQRPIAGRPTEKPKRAGLFSRT